MLKRIAAIVVLVILPAIFTNTNAQEATVEPTPQLPITLEMMQKTTSQIIRVVRRDGLCQTDLFLGNLTKYVFPMELTVGEYRKDGLASVFEKYSFETMPESTMLSTTFVSDAESCGENFEPRAIFKFKDGNSSSILGGVDATVEDQKTEPFIQSLDNGVWGIAVRPHQVNFFIHADYELYMAYTPIGQDVASFVLMESFNDFDQMLDYETALEKEDRAEFHTYIVVRHYDTDGVMRAVKLEYFSYKSN